MTALIVSSRTFMADSATLGERALRRGWRNPATVVGAVVFPLLFFGLFRLVMGKIMTSRGFDYQQALPPTIVIQAMLFAAMSSAFYVAEDRLLGFSARLRSMPMSRLAPIVGRAIGDVGRAALSLVAVMLVGVLTGMRFSGGVTGVAMFVLLSLWFAFAAGLGMGLLGAIASSPQGAVSVATIPYLPLLMLSSGFAPVEDFPGWLQPFVRWQPVSVVVEAMRASTLGVDVVARYLEAVAWLVAMTLVFSFFAARALGRNS